MNAATLAPPALLTCHLRISGRVQGVGYPWAMAYEAQALGLGGWVRNRLDGTVEALVCGAPPAVQILIDWAQQGPPLARVQAVDVTEVESEGPGALRVFVQRETA